jgi:fructose-bisphosphate aldolase class II
VEATGIDLFAPYIGNIHGIIKSGKPRLHPDHVKAIREAINIPLVLHGGSGSLNQDFIDSIKQGINIVHINTEIRLAYRDAVKKFLDENPNEVAPYRFLKPGLDAVQKVVTERLKLFSNIS